MKGMKKNLKKWHLRFGVTSNCNFRCKYCNSHNTYSSNLEDREIKEILDASFSNGIIRVHWTGGEPLFNDNICKYIKYANEIGYTEQSITTNGFFLEQRVKDLKESGISRINVSLDTLDKQKFNNIVGVDALGKVMAGIEKMLEMTDCLIKINMVVMKNNLNEIRTFLNYAKYQNLKYGKERIIVRFLQFFPCNPNQLEEDGKQFWANEYITEKDILNEIKKEGETREISRIEICGDNPSMKYYRVSEKLTVGILAMFSWKYPCGACYKLRISPQGRATICLSDALTVKLIGKSIDEKREILKELINRRENIDDKGFTRQHFRNSLGEFRFGKSEKQVNMEDFYKIIQNGKGRECNS